MTEKNVSRGHLAAFITIFIWGTTFISTKVLLKSFTPIEILFIRFLIGYAALWCVRPKFMPLRGRKQEGIFLLAGLCGICLYYLLENISLTFTQASNVGVIISTAPFFTAILTKLVSREKEQLGLPFFLGFIAAMAGICLISFSDGGASLNPTGDILALLAAFIWACYSVLTKKISGYGYSTIETTRRVFFYGIMFMVPVMFFSGFRPDMKALLVPVNLGNILFLGLGASALCFVTWNAAVRILGAVKTSVYIYLVPVITVTASVLILKEQITLKACIGMLLTLAGLWISEHKWEYKRKSPCYTINK
ncbi:DMT family transporter [[Clostridium] hylemonae]|uniref:DMT family transporter n=1 Tax=[Clostridium] hylemonae TaxID=89153 RepID=UPI001FCC2456|nr:DMT family transporter [[Clostridium] hylemonae]BDF03607.1 EamA family transporter [[Clostridium] hylemonae]